MPDSYGWDNMGANLQFFNLTATPTPLGYYGAFYDTTSQIATSSGGFPNPNQNNSAPMAMKFNSTEFSNGVSIQNNSEITIANTGVYNIQFSAQLYNTGGSTEKVWIWLRKNGLDLSDTNTFLPIGASTNNEQNVASWNFLVEAIGGDYFQIMWASSQWNKVELYYLPSSSNPTKPEIPSIILTVTQQAGIMAGTGITALNGLTNDVQTFATGETGMDFNIDSSGSTHTFNIPSASNLARGLVSIIAQTFAGVKTFLSAPILDSLTASRILATNGSKAVQSLDTTTYPDLTELSYVKGTTSAIQTQLNGKQATLPYTPVYVYAKDLSTYSSIGTGSQILTSLTIPANTFVAGDVLRITGRFKKVGTNSTSASTIFINNSVSLSGGKIVRSNPFAATTLANGQQGSVVIINATNLSQLPPTVSSATDIQLSTGAWIDSTAIDWTTTQYLIFSCAPNNALDVVSLIYYQIEKL